MNNNNDVNNNNDNNDKTAYYTGGNGKLDEERGYFEGPADGIPQDVKKIIIPDDLEEIGDGAFLDCEELTTVEFISPSNVKRIGEKAFCYCRSLQSIELPPSLEVIGELAFYCCYALATIQLPTKLKELHSQAFCDIFENRLLEELINLISSPKCQLSHLSLSSQFYDQFYEDEYDEYGLRKLRLLVEGLRNNNNNSNYSLKYLDLSYNSLGDISLEMILDILHECKQLVTLDLYYNEITDLADCIQTSQAIHHASKVEKIILNGNNAIDENIKEKDEATFDAIHQLMMVNRRLHTFCSDDDEDFYYQYFTSKLQHQADLNWAGGFLLVDGSDESNDIPPSVWKHVFHRIVETMDNKYWNNKKNIKDDEKKRKKLNVIYHLLREGPTLEGM